VGGLDCYTEFHSVIHRVTRRTLLITDNGCGFWVGDDGFAFVFSRSRRHRVPGGGIVFS